MGGEAGWIWAVVWLPWAVIVLLDILHEPRDWRWMVSATGLLVLAGWTWGRFPTLNDRVVIIAGFACVLLAGFAIGAVGDIRRRGRVKVWAAANGFQPRAMRPQCASRALPDPLLRLPILSKARFPKTDCWISRTESDGQEWHVFDLITSLRIAGLNAGRGPNTATMVALHRPGARLPLFQARPRDMSPWFDGGAIGDAVVVGSPTEFSRKFRLGGPEIRNLEALFGDEVTAAFASRPGWIVAGEGEWLVAAFFDDPATFHLKSPGLRIARPDQLSHHVADAEFLLTMVADRADRRAFPGVGAA